MAVRIWINEDGIDNVDDVLTGRLIQRDYSAQKYFLGVDTRGKAYCNEGGDIRHGEGIAGDVAARDHPEGAARRRQRVEVDRELDVLHLCLVVAVTVQQCSFRRRKKTQRELCCTATCASQSSLCTGSRRCR